MQSAAHITGNSRLLLPGPLRTAALCCTGWHFRKYTQKCTLHVSHIGVECALACLLVQSPDCPSSQSCCVNCRTHVWAAYLLVQGACFTLTGVSWLAAMAGPLRGVRAAIGCCPWPRSLHGFRTALLHCPPGGVAHLHILAVSNGSNGCVVAGPCHTAGVLLHASAMPSSAPTSTPCEVAGTYWGAL